MVRDKTNQILSGCSNVTARFLKFFGTSILNYIYIEQILVSIEKMDERMLKESLTCGSIASIASIIEALNVLNNHSKKIEKIHKTLLKSERFLDFNAF